MTNASPQPEGDEYFSGYVRGSSMELSGLVPGTLLHLQRATLARHDDIVLAQVDDQGATVKRYRETRIRGQVNGAWLIAESNNPDWRPTPVNDGVHILGVVVGFEVPGATSVCYNVPGSVRRPATVTSLGEALAARMFVAAALVQEDGPPLAYYLTGLARRIEGMGWTSFAKAIGLDGEAEFTMILAGHVPEPARLRSMARRLSILLGEDVPASELLRFEIHRRNNAS